MSSCSMRSYATTTKIPCFPGPRRGAGDDGPVDRGAGAARREAGKLGPVARLMPTTAATTLRKGKNEPLIIDGPFAETKEQLLGFYVIDFETLDEAIEFSKKLADRQSWRRLL